MSEWLEDKESSEPKATGGFLLSPMLLMDQIGDHFCNKCNGEGFVRMSYIERLFKSIWHRTPLKLCRWNKPCKCSYYVRGEL